MSFDRLHWPADKPLVAAAADARHFARFFTRRRGPFLAIRRAARSFSAADASRRLFALLLALLMGRQYDFAPKIDIIRACIDAIRARPPVFAMIELKHDTPRFLRAFQ